MCKRGLDTCAIGYDVDIHVCEFLDVRCNFSINMIKYLMSSHGYGQYQVQDSNW